MRHDAEQALRAWLVSSYAKDVNLADDEIDKLLAELVDRQYSSPPKVVDRIVRRMFPSHYTGEKNMQTPRVVPPREKTQAAAPPQQTQPQTAAELESIMAAYIRTNHWQSVASQFSPPWAFNGNVMMVGSRANLALLKNKLREILQGRPLRVSDVQEAVFALAQAGVLERVPEVKTVPVEAPEPDARELHNRQVRIDRAMNDRSTSPIRGAKESAKPLIKPTTNSNLAEAAASEKAERENAIVNEALSRINTFTSHTHGLTASGRAALRETFQMAMDQGLSAKEVLAAVETKASELAGNSSIR